MTKYLAAAALLSLLAVPAFAGSCPAQLRAVDDALAKNPSLSAAQMTEVKALREQGAKLHGEGKHADSIAAIGKAKGILKIQ
jgi:hypothetical protein